MKLQILINQISHEKANPMLESFEESPKACMTNSSFPSANLKGKENRDLSSVCSNYWPPIVALSLRFNPFRTFDLSVMQVCNHQEIRQAHSQYPPHSRVSLEKPPSLILLRTKKWLYE